jgi:hypothetical protein
MARERGLGESIKERRATGRTAEAPPPPTAAEGEEQLGPTAIMQAAPQIAAAATSGEIEQNVLPTPRPMPVMLQGIAGEPGERIVFIGSGRIEDTSAGVARVSLDSAAQVGGQPAAAPAEVPGAPANIPQPLPGAPVPGVPREA